MSTGSCALVEQSRLTRHKLGFSTEEDCCQGVTESAGAPVFGSSGEPPAEDPPETLAEPTEPAGSPALLGEPAEPDTLAEPADPESSLEPADTVAEPAKTEASPAPAEPIAQDSIPEPAASEGSTTVVEPMQTAETLACR